jgi:NAD+ synthase (glutamine-hydrolysing)
MAGFNCMYSYGFLRIACWVPRGRVADPAFAARAHLELAAAGHARHVGVMLFPELGLSSYAIDDLVMQDALLDRVEAAMAEIVAASRDLYLVLVVGAPLRRDGRLFNTAVVIHRGRVPARRRRATCRTIASFTNAGISRRASDCAAAR